MSDDILPVLVLLWARGDSSESSESMLSVFKEVASDIFNLERPSFFPFDFSDPEKEWYSFYFSWQNHYTVNLWISLLEGWMMEERNQLLRMKFWPTVMKIVVHGAEGGILKNLHCSCIQFSETLWTASGALAWCICCIMMAWIFWLFCILGLAGEFIIADLCGCYGIVSFSVLACGKSD